MSGALSPVIVQFGGSLIAIGVLAWLALKLGLGGSPELRTDRAVKHAASEVSDGFAAMAIARDTDGRAALAHDDAGRIMLLKSHGSRIAGRLLGPSARAELQQDASGHVLVVDCGERRFGTVSLRLPDAQTWADAINAL